MHRRQPTGDCIVSVLIQWATDLKLWGATGDSYVFEWQGESLITDESIAATMKCIANYIGLDDKLISAHVSDSSHDYVG
jgi:hypothetical protein